MRPDDEVDCADPTFEGLMRRFAGFRSSLSRRRTAPPAGPGSDLVQFNGGGLKVKKSRCPVCGRSTSRIALSIRDEQSRKLMSRSRLRGGRGARQLLHAY